jgi:DNA-cytosine methyltransferase
MENNNYNILSLFDGMSCFQIALNRLGIKYDTYYASEIDKYGIKVATDNYPDTVQLGDVTKIVASQLPKIDILVGGSPCQGFSIAGKMLNFDDERSKLFFEFVRLKNELKPRYFLLENVYMKQEWVDIISKLLGVNPICINSRLVSAQNRKRLYWTNIGMEAGGLFGEPQSIIKQPENKKIVLKDILEKEVNNKYFLSINMLEYFGNRAANFNNGKVNIRDIDGKASTITASSKSIDISDNFVLDTDLSLSTNQDKARTLTVGGNSGGLHSDMTLIAEGNMDKQKQKDVDLEANFKNANGIDYRGDEGFRFRKDGKSPALLARAREDKYGLPMIIASRGRFDKALGKIKQRLEPRNDGKSNTITSVEKDNLVLLIPEATKKGYTEVKEGECFDMSYPKSKTRRGRLLEYKSNAVMAKVNAYFKLEKIIKVKQLSLSKESGGKQPYQHNRVFHENGLMTALDTDKRKNVYTKYRIRRLTPVECERLQTVPDNYTKAVSDSQRYKMLGNGFTVDVICHILSYIKK